MPNALETIAAFATFENNVITSLVAAAGQSLVVRNASLQSDVRLAEFWAYTQAAGITRVRSPRLHDNVNGIREQTLTKAPQPFLPYMPVQKLYPQDTLILEQAVADAAGNIEYGFLMLYYQDLPGIAARLIDPVALMQRGINVVGVEVDTTPTVAGGWTGASALNKTTDNLKANTDYALMGYTLSAACGGVAIQGPDTGNLLNAGPGLINDPIITQEWWVRLSLKHGIPLIPVINSANKQGTTIYIAQDQGGAAVNVSLNFVELAQMGAASPTARPAGT